MLNQTNAKRVVAGGAAQPTTFGLQLCYWRLPTTAANMGWGLEPLAHSVIHLDVLGVWSSRKVRIDIQAVFPKNQLPQMNDSAKTIFIKALKKAIEDKAGVPVSGLARGIIDWDGNQTEWGYE